MELAMLTNYESDAEKNQIFAVIEDRGDRLVIAPVNSDLIFGRNSIVPTELVSRTDIRIVGDTCKNS